MVAGLVAAMVVVGWSVVLDCRADGRARPDGPTRTAQAGAAAARKPTVAPADVDVPVACWARASDSKRSYCDVLTGRDSERRHHHQAAAARGPVTLRFNLHNRHTYSERKCEAKRAFASYTAAIGVLTLDNTLLTRAVVATSSGRSRSVERISGGAGPGGVKAVAPVGPSRSPWRFPRPSHRSRDSRREADRGARRRQPGNYSAPGRPIAIISDVTARIPAGAGPARHGRLDTVIGRAC